MENSISTEGSVGMFKLRMTPFVANGPTILSKKIKNTKKCDKNVTRSVKLFKLSSFDFSPVFFVSVNFTV